MSRVLIVEDEVAIAEMYKFKLEHAGYSVICAYNGKEGLKKAKEFEPHLILLDLRMPVMSGDVMLESLRAKDWAKEMRVIILTNISKDEAPPSLRFLGVDRYIVKAHVIPSDVVTIVSEVLGKNG